MSPQQQATSRIWDKWILAAHTQLAHAWCTGDPQLIAAARKTVEEVQEAARQAMRGAA